MCNVIRKRSNASWRTSRSHNPCGLNRMDTHHRASRHHRSMQAPEAAEPDRHHMSAEPEAAASPHQSPTAMKSLNPSQTSRLHHRFRFDGIWESRESDSLTIGIRISIPARVHQRAISNLSMSGLLGATPGLIFPKEVLSVLSPWRSLMLDTLALHRFSEQPLVWAGNDRLSFA